MAITAQAKILNSFTVSYNDFFGTKRLNQAVDKYFQSYNKLTTNLVWSVYIPTTKEGEKSESGVVVYAFIEEHGLNLPDGVKYSEPIYKVTYNLPSAISDSKATIEALADIKKVKFERQGNRPLSTAESHFLSKKKQNWADASLTILKINKKINNFSQDDKNYFCLWSKLNAVIYQSIKDQHAQFFDGLKCNNNDL
jgi:hypothetical protein